MKPKLFYYFLQLRLAIAIYVLLWFLWALLVSLSQFIDRKLFLTLSAIPENLLHIVFISVAIFITVINIFRINYKNKKLSKEAAELKARDPVAYEKSVNEVAERLKRLEDIENLEAQARYERRPKILKMSDEVSRRIHTAQAPDIISKIAIGILVTVIIAAMIYFVLKYVLK